jgi:hypothetical protein
VGGGLEMSVIEINKGYQKIVLAASEDYVESVMGDARDLRAMIDARLAEFDRTKVEYPTDLIEAEAFAKKLEERTATIGRLVRNWLELHPCILETCGGDLQRLLTAMAEEQGRVESKAKPPQKEGSDGRRGPFKALSTRRSQHQER